MQETNYLIDVLALLGAAVVAVPLFQRLGLGSVLGYLVAGVLVGPWGLGIIDQVDEIRHLAEFGVVFLLFIIGIELKPARLWIMRRLVFGLGSAQVVLTGLVLAGFALWFGIPGQTAVVVGFGLALSSTAFGLQILSERGQLGSVTGRTSFSVLLLQDLAIVPLLALVSLLGQDASLVEGVEYAVLEAVLIIVVVILAGRFLLTPLLQLVAGSRTAEVFTATAILTVLGTAWLMSVAGLSMALGAFLAGLMLADSHYRHQVVADIQPFRGLLLGLFFMSVGMSIDFGLFDDRGLLIAGLVVGLLLIKALLLWGLCRVMGVGAVEATRTALLLSQSGEFGFVLFGLALVNGVMTADLFHLLMPVIALTMVTTPLMANLGERLERYMTRKPGSHDVSTAGVDAEQPYVIVAGFGRVGRRIARILEAAGIPYFGMESNPDRVAQGRADGYAVFYGDASRVDVLQAAGVGRARVLVSTLDKTLPAARLVNVLRQHYPDTPIYTRGHDSSHCRELSKAGATLAISETLEASLQLGAAVLEVSAVP
ncbi:MAG: monovalent cation:proton antiporter-2 (CPA2) family protein, partial [Gammaproteobacteria bacterium]|nr:monovalent cation:proton antiporter-2 (CPA2) family protein [Gammaproteobacteria bacterium]